MTTFKGKGLIPDSHPLGCGVLGRSGTPIASWFMNESDVLVVFGASFSNHTGITPKKPTIQVDLDPMILGKFHSVEVPVWGEIGVTASLLRDGLGDETGFMDRRNEVAERWAIWREEKKRREADTSDVGLGSAAIFAALNRHVPENAIIAVDVGNNTYSFGRYFECQNQAVLMSGYLGSIGFALDLEDSQTILRSLEHHLESRLFLVFRPPPMGTILVPKEGFHRPYVYEAPSAVDDTRENLLHLGALLENQITAVFELVHRKAIFKPALLNLTDI